MVTKMNSKKNKQTIDGHELRGELLDDGMCRCAICGRKAKMGSAIMPKNEVDHILILCKPCSNKEAARRNSVTEDEAAKSRERMFAVNHLMMDVFHKKYLDLAEKDAFDNLNEANDVMKEVMRWWNEELSIQDRYDFDDMSEKEIKDYFMNVEIDFSNVEKKYRYTGQKIERNDPCPCGSGKKYKKCCLAN